MVSYNPPSSSVTVDLPDALVERYEAAGWTPVSKSRATRKSRSSDAENDDK